MKRKKIISYLENGGKAIILSDYTEIEMPNFNSVLENYGVQPENGIILEGDQDHYIAQNQYYLLPNIESHEINSNLSSKSKYVLTALSPGIKSLENVRDTIKIDSILTTSDSAYQKTDLENMETTEKEDGDLEGPFPLAVSITEDLGDDKKTQIVYFASSAIFNDQMNATVSGANYELLSSSLSWLCGTEEDNSISIPSKSYDMTALMVPSSDASFWSIFVTAVVPVTILLVGFGILAEKEKISSMKKKKGLIAGIVILLILIGVYIGLKVAGPKEKEEQTEEKEITAFEINAEDIAQVSIENNGVLYTFVKEEETWKYTEDENFPLNQAVVSNLVSE